MAYFLHNNKKIYLQNFNQQRAKFLNKIIYNKI